MSAPGERARVAPASFGQASLWFLRQVMPYPSAYSTAVQFRLSGELDATLMYLNEPNLIDRSTADLSRHPEITTLFPDPIAEGVRYYKKTGLYPINHGMVVKRELAERHPWILLNLLNAFDRASAIADKVGISKKQVASFFEAQAELACGGPVRLR